MKDRALMTQCHMVRKALTELFNRDPIRSNIFVIHKSPTNRIYYHKYSQSAIFNNKFLSMINNFSWSGFINK